MIWSTQLQLSNKLFCRQVISQACIIMNKLSPIPAHYAIFLPCLCIMQAISYACVLCKLSHKPVYYTLNLIYLCIMQIISHTCILCKLSRKPVYYLNYVQACILCNLFHMPVYYTYGRECSRCGDVISGVVQGSIIRPAFYIIFINLLLKKITFPCQVFADDLKFIADAIENNQEDIQQRVSSIVQWADEHQALLSFDKSSVLHCGCQEVHNTHYIHDSAN